MKPWNASPRRSRRANPAIPTNPMSRACSRRAKTRCCLLSQGEDAVLKKIGEEATETVLAAKSGDKLHLVRETADLWFHSLILLARHGLGPGDVLAELHRREGISGLDEKASRKR